MRCDVVSMMFVLAGSEEDIEPARRSRITHPVDIALDDIAGTTVRDRRCQAQARGQAEERDNLG